MDCIIGMSLSRPACPSCHHRLSPLAVECPVCGLGFGERVLPRPLLFQASALKSAPPAVAAPQALRAPALGRVSPVQIHAQESEPPPSGAPFLPQPREAQSPVEAQDETTSFWPLVLLEGSECLALVLLNLVLAGLITLASSASFSRLYQELWPYLLPLHLAVSWTFVMVPLVLTGQTLLMAPKGILLAADQPERRIAFSVLHLVSVTAFPLSFLCLVLTREHQTLAEVLSGQEILLKAEPRMRS